MREGEAMSGPVVRILTPEGGVMTVQGTVLTGEGNVFGEQYGAGGLPIFDQLRLLAQWGPLLGHLQAIASATTAKAKARAVLSALLFAAGKTDTKIDDEIIGHFEDILETPEGAEMFDWIASLVKGSRK